MLILVLALIILFALNIIVGLLFGFGLRHYWFFELLHFLGGFFVAMFLANFTNSAVLIFSGLFVVTVLWELVECLIARMKKLSEYMNRKFGPNSASWNWKDTLLDAMLNFLGALTFIYLF